MEDAEAKFPFPFPSAEQGDSFSVDVSAGQLSNLPSSSTLLVSEKSCFTTEGKLGSCTSVRSCYPKFKLPQLSNLETWVIGTRGTCHYVEKDGRQVNLFYRLILLLKLSRKTNEMFTKLWIAQPPGYFLLPNA